MNRIYLIISVLLGIALSSCQNASFINPADTNPVISDFWATGEKSLDISGEVHDGHGGGHHQFSAHVIAAWEMPNDPSRSLYVYGTGTFSGFNNHTFSIHLRDTLPKFILLNKDTTNAIAAGHIFLIGDAAIKDGDTLRYNSNWDSAYQMIGSMNDIGVIFIKGNPVLAGQNLNGQFPSGFNLLHAKSVDPTTDRVIEFESADNFNSEIEVDDDGQNCKNRTPFWLQ